MAATNFRKLIFVARMTLAALIDELASLPLRIRHSLSPENGFTRLAARH
ncbi:hypothetical protein [Ottowia cancrivicina]|uniref:Uncharacterized protein n=1 Tax=Ottowia cancrivicina TaxID=3040346 RepID=A0AAW6RKB6_9BURK|nr:hypothetical protein [Ottowia sp. 10c7w1]MDG9699935.1 hypothetical protein [Ottowia sp. 10c7w1]